MKKNKILVTGFGNLLQRDDGFGVVLLKRLENDTSTWPAEIHFVDVGIGGITLVQELLTKFDVLIVLDAIEGDISGTVKVLEVSPNQKSKQTTGSSSENDFHHQDRFADIHYAEPGRAIALAHEVGVLPKHVFMIGCVPVSTELGHGLSTEVANAIDIAVETFHKLVENLASDSPQKMATEITSNS